MISRRQIGLLLICALLAAGYIYRDKWLPQGSSSQQATPSSASGKRNAGPITVIIAKAETGSLPITRQTIGSIVPTATSTLTTGASGMLTDVLVQDGATVNKGDLIAQLDTRTIRATIAKDEATLLKDKATLQNSVITANRTQELLAKGFSSKQSANDADTASRVAAAAETYNLAVLAADHVALALTEIRAPFDGRLGTILLSPGAYVSPGTSVASITQLDTVFAEFALPDRDLDIIRKASIDNSLTVSVVAQSAPLGQTVQGPIVFIDNTVDAGSGTFKMKAKLANADHAFLSGQAINVDVTAGTLQNLIIVPNQAVTPTATGNAVYVVKDDNTVEVRPVEIALRADKVAGLSKGLAAGEQVVIEGQINLVNGAPVKISLMTSSNDPAAAVDPAKKENNKKKKTEATAKTESSTQ